MALRQGSISGYTVGSFDSEFITRFTDQCGALQVLWRTTTRSLEESLSGQKWCWAMSERDWNQVPGVFTIYRQDGSLQLWLWRRGWTSSAGTMLKLDRPQTVAGGAGGEDSAISGFPGGQRAASPAWCLGQQACLWAVAREGWSQVQEPLGAQIECFLKKEIPAYILLLECAYYWSKTNSFFSWFNFFMEPSNPDYPNIINLSCKDVTLRTSHFKYREEGIYSKS